MGSRRMYEEGVSGAQPKRSPMWTYIALAVAVLLLVNVLIVVALAMASRHHAEPNNSEGDG